MRRNKLAVFLHLVWATWDRTPLITPDVERSIHRCIHTEAQQQGCKVLALNGMPDHVHLLVILPSTCSIAELTKQVKGVSSRFANLELFKHAEFKWQGSYGAFSVSRWDVDKIVAYIRDQKKHHAEQSIVEEWEEMFEAVEQKPPSPTRTPPPLTQTYSPQPSPHLPQQRHLKPIPTLPI